MEGSPSSLDDPFWIRLAAALPEFKDVQLTNPDYIGPDATANLALDAEADVFVTFLHENTTLRSSVGFFTFQAAAVPQSPEEIQPVIVFPNVSYSGSGGSGDGLQAGDTLHLGRFPAGTIVGFVLVADGFDPNTGVALTVDPSRVFYTVAGVNPESDPSLRVHSVLLQDQAGQGFVLGFEDRLRGSSAADDDFNDVLFLVTTAPAGAADESGVVVLPQASDGDGDGVLDANDDFPDDPQRAFRVDYPSSSMSGTLAFEDQWPAQGDYDLNDLVLRYGFEQVLNAAGAVKDLGVRLDIVARGAMYQNGFGIEWPGLSAAALALATRSTNGGAPLPLVPEEGQRWLTLIAFEDATSLSPQAPGCRFLNTEPNCPHATGGSVRVDLTFSQAQSTAAIGAPPFNPFLYRTGRRGLEVHLPDRPPTSRADPYLLGTSADTSNKGLGRYYKTANNLPFALEIPTDWRYPLETAPIMGAYLSFAPWAESGGTLHPGWYLSNTDEEKIY